jgi:hypothetical protein
MGGTPPFDPVKYLTDLEVWLAGLPNKSNAQVAAFAHLANAKACFIRHTDPVEKNVEFQGP